MSCFPNLKKLFSVNKFFAGWFSNNKSGDKETRSAKEIHAPTNFGDGGCAIGTLIVKLERPDAEDKLITLSSFEKEVLIALSEGAEIICSRGEDAKIEDAHIYGNEKAEAISPSDLYTIFFEMYRKGLIDRDLDLHYIISKVGRRIIQRIDEQSHAN